MSSHPPHSKGYDASVCDPAQDYLNRWPLAQQIYNVAANGPIDWCVRIGVYGEWGTGKTSVLKFVDSLAKKNGHIPVWFDPWAYTDQTEMWHAYVRSIHEALKDHFGPIEEVQKLAKGSWLSQAPAISKIVGAVTKEGGELTAIGLTWLKKYFVNHTEALHWLRNVLRNKRVFVFIDDLDRTAPELVPDILYALKEVMDTPGFAFICGFDPAVVGKVLGNKHPGFGDGLKFLEKIIDYPVWLPPIKPEGLAKIALADAKLHCPFVPEDALKEVLPDLPQNPRAIRQFIRLLSLLGAQVNRYHEHELRWSVILSATVLKVLHPKTAATLLTKRTFWEAFRAEDPLDDVFWDSSHASGIIRDHIKDTLDSFGHSLVDSEKSTVGGLLYRIGKDLSYWRGADVNLILSQITITEQPQAVTGKEFDHFFTELDSLKLREPLESWIVDHASTQHHLERDVAAELCVATVDRYCTELHNADEGFDPEKTPVHKSDAIKALSILEVLIFELTSERESLCDISWIPLGHIYDKLVSLSAAPGPAHAEQWPHTEKFLVQLAKISRAEVKKLLAVWGDLSRKSRGDAKEQKLLSDLDLIVGQHFSHMAAQGLSQESFVNRTLFGGADFNTIGNIIRNWDHPQYAEYRSLALRHFKEDSSNPNVRQNAYQIVEWLEGAFSNPNAARKQTVERLLRDKEMVMAIWNAATCNAFSQRLAYALRDFPGILKTHGVDVSIPHWWDASIKEHEGFIQSLIPPPTVPAPIDDETPSPAESTDS